MFCPDVPFVRVDFEGGAELHPMIGRRARCVGTSSSERPAQTARAGVAAARRLSEAGLNQTWSFPTS